MYSETCLNQTLNKVPMLKIFVMPPSTNACLFWTQKLTSRRFGLDRFHCIREVILSRKRVNFMALEMPWDFKYFSKGIWDTEIEPVLFVLCFGRMPPSVLLTDGLSVTSCRTNIFNPIHAFTHYTYLSTTYFPSCMTASKK